MVLGGGFAGLVTAGVLADFYQSVTVVERDPIPAPGESRRGAPQGRHTHNLLPAGARALEQIFPGLMAELVADGAVAANMLVGYRFYLGGNPLPQVPIGAPAVQATRPFYEQHLRRRLQALAGVRLLSARDVVGLEADAARIRFTGVRVVAAGGTGTAETLAADLVVDAMGRASRTPVWLDELGYPRPAEQRVEVDVAYSSRPLRLRAEDAGTVGHLVGGVVNRIPRAILLLAVENGDFLLTLNGVGSANRPPTDDTGFAEFLETAAPGDVVPALSAAEALGPTSAYRFRAATRRRYEELDRFPDGLLVTGDAFCTLNPINAQGMTVAALEAIAVKRCLERGRRALPARFHRAAAQVVAGPWQATAAPATTPARPSRAARLRARLMARVLAAATRDRVVAARFGRVLAMIDPPAALLRPALLWRALRLAPQQPGRVRTPRPVQRVK